MSKIKTATLVTKNGENITLRQALRADAAGIAKVHVDSWRSTYKGIVPDEYLANLSHEKRETFWDQALADQPARSHTIVATDHKNQVLGFSDGGANRTTKYNYDGEILAIYLLKDHHGTGVGRRLFQSSVNQLREDGFSRMLVWVLADNPTCRFYERMGGKVVGEKIEKIGGKTLKELAYGWETLVLSVTT